VSLPRVFVTRRIPEAGLALLANRCQVDLWPEPMPPPHEVLVSRSKECEGILSLLTDKIRRPVPASCPKLKVVSNFAVGLNISMCPQPLPVAFVWAIPPACLPMLPLILPFACSSALPVGW